MILWSEDWRRNRIKDIKGENDMVEELKSMVGMDETILYEGKPDKKCFIFESILNPLLPI